MDSIKLEGLSVLVFRKHKKEFKSFSTNGTKVNTDFVFKPKGRIYGYSNDFKKTTFLSIGKPNDVMVSNQLNLIFRKNVPNTVYHAWIPPEDISEEMLKELTIRDFDHAVLYEKSVQTKHIKRIDKVSMSEKSLVSNYFNVFWKTLFASTGMVSLTIAGEVLYKLLLQERVLEIYNLLLALL
jgi:hypothetical protein